MLENIVISTEDIQVQAEDGRIPQPPVRTEPDGSQHYGMIATPGKVEIKERPLDGVFRPIVSNIGHNPE